MRHELLLPAFTPGTLNQLMRGTLLTRMRRSKGDREVVCHYAAESGIPKATGKRRVSLVVTLGKGQRPFDVDAPWKGMLDSLRHAGLILDDIPACCAIGSLTFDRGERKTMVILEDLENTHDHDHRTVR